jgi:BirA family biotin operon repressor/biotin-[acetyl-CoA-carboxylase] ligase
LSHRFETVRDTGSTNADLLARIEAGEQLAEGAWLIADRQRTGRGRQGRTWIDAAGNFMGSTVVWFEERDPPAPSLSLVAGLAVHEAVLARMAAPHHLQLKWPNDLLLGGAKVAGILMERSGNSAVVGIGVNLAAAPAMPDRAASSLRTIGPAPERDSFARDLAGTFERELARWRQFGLEPIIARWLAAAHPVGSPLSVHGPDGARLAGAFDGLAPDGALRLRLADGSLRVIHAGDVALERN